MADRRDTTDAVIAALATGFVLPLLGGMALARPALLSVAWAAFFALIPLVSGLETG